MKVGVVGLGKMGLLHASILNILPDVQLVAVCEKSSLVSKLAKKVLNGVTIVDDVGKFSNLNLDVVYVTTSTSSHYSVAKTIYQERLAKHLFIEKPLSSSYGQSKELCELAAQNSGVNMVGYLRRFMVTFMKAKELLVQGSVGEVVSFDIGAFSSDFYDIRDNPKVSIARGGVLRDLGSYAFDLAFWFFGDVQLGSAEIKALTGAGAQDASYIAVHGHSTSMNGSISVSWCKEGYRMPEVNLAIKGSRGVIEVNDDRVSLLLDNGQSSVWYRLNLDDNVGFWLGGPEYYREDLYFLKSVLSGSVAEPSFEAASKVDLFIDEVQERAERGN